MNYEEFDELGRIIHGYETADEKTLLQKLKEIDEWSVSCIKNARQHCDNQWVGLKEERPPLYKKVLLFDGESFHIMQHMEIHRRAHQPPLKLLIAASDKDNYILESQFEDEKILWMPIPPIPQEAQSPPAEQESSQ